MRKLWVVLAAVLASGTALAADAIKKDLDSQGRAIMDRLYANTGVYHRPATAAEMLLDAHAGTLPSKITEANSARIALRPIHSP